MATETHSGGEEGGLVFHPMDQFIVKPFFGEGGEVAWYTVTNATVWMFLAVVAVFLLLVLGSSKRGVVPSRMQSVAELAYGFLTLENRPGDDVLAQIQALDEMESVRLLEL